MFEKGKLFLNSCAVLFDYRFDRLNNFETIVFNPVSKECLKIDSNGYQILKLIDENPGIEVVKLISMSNVGRELVLKFLDLMIKENVIFLK